MSRRAPRFIWPGNTSAAARAAATVRFRPLVAEDALKARYLGERRMPWWRRLLARFTDCRRMFG